MDKELLRKAFAGLHDMASSSLKKKVRGMYKTEDAPEYEPGNVMPEERSVTAIKVTPSVSAPRPSSPVLADASKKQELDDDTMDALAKLFGK